jgi:hypothetical protein
VIPWGALSDEIPSSGDVLLEVGGDVDEVHITLVFHGDDLDPEQLSRLLGCSPTSSHRKGEPRPGLSATAGPWTTGTWLLTVEGKAPQTVSELLGDLLRKLPDDETLWLELSRRWRVSIWIGVFLGQWNRGFELEAPLVERVARMHASLSFDIYAEQLMP